MDPQLNREPALRLPQPMPEQAAWASGGAASERAPMPEIASPPSQFAPAAPVSATPLLSQQTSLQQATQSTSSPLATQQVVTSTNDVNDERVWIERAKRIIEQTHTDPFLESQEIGKFKAEYLKDVHTKNIKIAEG